MFLLCRDDTQTNICIKISRLLTTGYTRTHQVIELFFISFVHNPSPAFLHTLMINMPPKILITSSIIYSQKKKIPQKLRPFSFRRFVATRKKKIIQTIYLRVKRGQARARSSNWQPKVRKVLNFLHDDELPSSHLHQSARFFCRFERDYLWPTDVRNRLIGAEAEGLAARGGSLWIISARLIIPRSAPQKPAGLILTSGGLSLSRSEESWAPWGHWRMQGLTRRDELGLWEYFS